MRFCSIEMSPSERPEAYRQALMGTFGYLNTNVDVKVEVGEPEGFSASIESFRIGRLRSNMHRSNAVHHLIHVAANRSTAIEVFLVSAGQIHLASSQNEVHLRSGDLLLWSPAKEWQASHGSFELMAFGLPDAVVRRRAPWLISIIGKPIAGTSGLATCLTALMCQASQCHERLTPEEGLILETTLIETICLLGQPDRFLGRSALSTPRDKKLEALKLLALESLESCDLCARTLARDAGLSARSIHRLFAASGISFQAWLIERRLERCWTELTNLRGIPQRTIAELAYSLGFNDLSTFNRAFRKRFGMTPMQTRRLSGSDWLEEKPQIHR